MKKVTFFSLSLVFIYLSFIFIPKKHVYAQITDDKCPNKYYEPKNLTNDHSKYPKLEFGIQVYYDVPENHRFAFVADEGEGNDYISEWKKANEYNQIFGQMLADSGYDPDQFTTGEHKIWLYRLSDQDYSNQINPDTPPSRNQLTKPFCEEPIIYKVAQQYVEPPPQLTCKINTDQESGITENTEVKLIGTIDPPAKYEFGPGSTTSYEGVIDYHGDKATSAYLPSDDKTINALLGTFENGSYKITYTITRVKKSCYGAQCTVIEMAVVCNPSLTFFVGEDKKTVIEPSPFRPPNPSSCYINDPKFDPVLDCDAGDNFFTCYGCDGYASDKPKNRFKQPDLTPLCDTIKSSLNEQQLEACKRCVIPYPTYPYIEGIDYKGIWTAIGCVPTDVPTILKDYVWKYGMGIAGGIAFLYFLYGAFLILTSMGNPERINNGKEIMISSISGLLLIIFSIFILQVIGVKILRIPGFE